MSQLFNKILPWNWFTPEGPTKEDVRKSASRAIAGTKRRRDGLPEQDSPKRRKLSNPENPTANDGISTQHLDSDAKSKSKTNTKSTSKNTHTVYWTPFDINFWMNKSGSHVRAPDSSVAHATTIADFDAQAQLQEEAAAYDSTADAVLIQSRQSPHTNGKGVYYSARPITRMLPPERPVKGEPMSRRTPRQSMARASPEHDVENRSVISVPQSTASKRRFPEASDFDLEQARRHAAAVELPNDSGMWALSEKRLFYHLALRGFEPLLPQNWMVDFKTLPISLFATDSTDQPLIKVLQGSEFRALRALRDLIETGKVVRDKSFSGPYFHVEKTIEKSVKDYFTWALSDAGFDTLHDDYVPNHIIMTKKKGQTTADAISLLNTKLSKLASRHRERLGILSSVEGSGVDSSLPSQLRNNATQVYDDAAPSEPPVVVGILIVSAIVVIFTLNGYNAMRSDDADIDNSGLRFIAKFDFSDAAYDVWNAIAVAITAVQVRAGMETSRFEKIVQMKTEPGSVEGQVNEDEDVNISPGRIIKGKKVVNSGWFGGEGYEGDKTVVIDDDPDR